MQPANVRPAHHPDLPAPQRPRLAVVPDPAPLPIPVHPAERRMRGAGGPDDRATYPCVCGCVFVAHVTTTVDCPDCGTRQAW